MGVDPDTRQASLILMSSFTGKMGHWAHQNTKVLYILNFVSQLVDLVRSSFVVKDCKVKHLQLLIKCEQNGIDISEYIRKFNDSYSFWKSGISEKCVVYLFVMGLRSGPSRADLMSAYGLESSNHCLNFNCTRLEGPCLGFLRGIKNLRLKSL